MTTPRSWWARLVDNPGLAGRIRRQWPWLIVVGLVALGLALIAVRAWRWGAACVGLGMVAAGFFRTTLRNPGILAIRKHRWVDLIFYYGAGIATILLAIIVPNK